MHAIKVHHKRLKIKRMQYVFNKYELQGNEIYIFRNVVNSFKISGGYTCLG